jgi:hypothetical protein
VVEGFGLFLQAAQHFAHQSGEPVALQWADGVHARRAAPTRWPGLLVQGLDVAGQLRLTEHHAIQPMMSGDLQVKRLLATRQHELEPVGRAAHEAQAMMGLSHRQADPDATLPGAAALAGGAVGRLLKDLQALVGQLAHLAAKGARRGLLIVLLPRRQIAGLDIHILRALDVKAGSCCVWLHQHGALLPGGFSNRKGTSSSVPRRVAA